MKHNTHLSFWESDSFLEPYDLIVVGAGIVGLSAAIFFRREHPHTRVLVLEKGFLPQGASTRNAGFACVGSITEHLADMEKESEENIKKRIKARYEGLHTLRSLLGDRQIGYNQCGGCELFTDHESFEAAADRIPQFNDWLNELTGEEEVYSTGTLNGYSVIRNRLEGALHPGRMMQAFIREAGFLGVEIKWSAPVSGIAENGQVTVNNEHIVKGEQVLAATNGFTKKLLPDLEVVPARGLVLVTGERLSMPWRGTFHHDRGYIYFRDVGNRLLIGGGRNIDTDTEETDQFGTNESIRKHLVNFVSETLRFGTDWEIEHRWSGIMGFTPTKTPVVKRLDDHRLVAAGLSGMGVAIGAEIGKQAAEIASSKHK